MNFTFWYSNLKLRSFSNLVKSKTISLISTVLNRSVKLNLQMKISKAKAKRIKEAFSKSPQMIAKKKRAAEVFNSPQFAEFIKNRNKTKKGPSPAK